MLRHIELRWVAAAVLCNPTVSNAVKRALDHTLVVLPMSQLVRPWQLQRALMVLRIVLASNASAQELVACALQQNPRLLFDKVGAAEWPPDAPPLGWRIGQPKIKIQPVHSLAYRADK